MACSRVVQIEEHPVGESSKAFWNGDHPEAGEYENYDSILPVEIWNMVFGYINASSDLQSLSDASPIFCDILRKRKTTWLFDQVLPHIFKDLLKSDLLNIRLVCQKWSKALDNYVAYHPSLLPFNEDTFRSVQTSFNYLPLSTKVYDDIAFVNGDQFVEFLSDMEGHPRNPFFGRSIRIGSCGDLFEAIDDAIDETWEGAAHLCNEFGASILHVEFANYEFSLTPLDFYKGICGSLQSLPNLKSLHMNGALDEEQDEDKTLLAYMSTHPPPELPHLETLIFDLVMEMEPAEEELQERQSRALPHDPEVLVDYLQDNPQAIQMLLNEIPPTPDAFQDKFITSYGKQIKKLEIDLPSWREEYSSLLENLTEIHLKHVTCIPTLTSLLTNLKAGKAHLGKLVVSLRCSMKVAELLQILQPLRIISLDFGYLGEAPDDYLVDTGTDQSPSIPSLLLLRAKDSINMTFEFLAKFPSLQHLDVWECQNAKKQFLQKESLEFNQTHEITSCLRQLVYVDGDSENLSAKVSSNIWKLLPSLRIITYRTRSGLPSIIRRFSRESVCWQYVCSY